MFSWLSCEKYTKSLSRSLDEPLRPGEKPIHWLHWAICLSCRRFRRQLLFIEHIMGRCRDEQIHLPPGPEGTLSAQAREKIQQSIEAELTARS